MITPRRTTLVRVADLHAFHRAIAARASAGDVAQVRSSAVIVSTNTAADQLRSTLENLALLGDDARVPVAAWPEILTRDGWYERLHHGSPAARRRLSAIEREVLMARAARHAIAAGHRPPFRLRPALVAEMLRFFDTMARLGRTLDAFERLVGEELEPRVAIDRGAERLLRQTRFLVASFREYQDLVTASGGHDEHTLRAHLLAQDLVPPSTRVVVTVGDRSCGSDGLWPADFDVLARLPHLEQVEIIATENMLAAGFHERLHDLLPGFEEIVFGQPAALTGRVPALVTPAGSEAAWWVSRDREEEIGSIARRIKHRLGRPPAADRAGAASLPLHRVAIVCKRPLPYVYVAQACFAAAGIPVQAFDDLPLAAEPFAAAVDLVFRFVLSGFARRHALALLRSPHFTFRFEGEDLAPDAVTALESALRDANCTAEPDTLARLAAEWSGPDASAPQRTAAPAAAALVQAARRLEPLRQRQPASAQFDVLLSFLEAHLRSAEEPLATRTARARGAVFGALRDLRAAHRRHDDPPIDLEEVVSRIRRWMEAQTFSPRTGQGGVHLVDADAARYGDFDEAHLVGVVEREWPDKEGRTIFYPLALLNQLGWPPERLRLAAARAAFRDLVRLPGERVSVSAFVLEDDALVELSPLLDELARAGLALSVEAPPANLRIVAEEALSLEPVCVEALPGGAREWAGLRQARSLADDERYHGFVGPVAIGTLAVRRLEMYLDCPFRYFAEAVLGLRDESDDDPAEGPRAQGQFLHEVLAVFFQTWQASGGGAITTATIDAARELFVNLVETRLATLGRADAVLWRARLLGSAARPGVGEIVFRAEAAASDDVVERLLEHRLDGPCRLSSTGDADRGPVGSRTRTVNLRGTADRIDVLSGKRLRVVDYKLGRAPDVRRAVQLPLYAGQAEQQFAARDGGAAVVTEAAYLAFGEREPYVALASRGHSVAQAIAEGQDRALHAIDGIERGSFPPRPAQPFLCGYCPYAGVCRKDYVDGPQ